MIEVLGRFCERNGAGIRPPGRRAGKLGKGGDGPGKRRKAAFWDILSLVALAQTLLALAQRLVALAQTPLAHAQRLVAHAQTLLALAQQLLALAQRLFAHAQRLVVLAQRLNAHAQPPYVTECLPYQNARI